VQKFYGMKGYDKLRQLAFGLVLGEFMAELIWATFSMINERQVTYSISINGKMSWDQWDFPPRPQTLFSRRPSRGDAL
jgi:hypothetical protein